MECVLIFFNLLHQSPFFNEIILKPTAFKLVCIFILDQTTEDFIDSVYNGKDHSWYNLKYYFKL